MMQILLSSMVFLCSFFSIGVTAQLLPVRNTFQTDLAKIIGDYPNHFKNLAGIRLENKTQVSEYNCTTSVKDAISCKVKKYSSSSKEVYSWEAEMARTEEFETAEKKFRQLYNSIQNLSVELNGSRAVFKSQYKKPVEQMKFTSVVFDSSEKFPSLKKLKVELLMEAEMLEWIVKILVYEKEREDDERGPIAEQ